MFPNLMYCDICFRHRTSYVAGYEPWTEPLAGPVVCGGCILWVDYDPAGGFIYPDLCIWISTLDIYKTKDRSRDEIVQHHSMWWTVWRKLWAVQNITLDRCLHKSKYNQKWSGVSTKWNDYIVYYRRDAKWSQWRTSQVLNIVWSLECASLKILCKMILNAF